MLAVEDAPFVPAPVISRLIALIPAALVPGVALVLAIRGGGFYSSAWYPIALLEAAALVAVHLAVRPRPLARAQTGALGAMAAFCAWSYLSITWAGLPGSALTEANRSTTYLMAIALVALVADSRERNRDLSIVFAAASALLAGYIAVRLSFGDASGLFSYGRLYRPIGYPNALAAFMLVGLWPLVATAANHEEHPAARGAALAAAALIPPIALLTLSRGGALFAIIGAVVYFAISPIRIRSLLATSFVFAPVVLGWGTLRQPGIAAQLTPGMLHACGHVALIGAVVAAIAGAGWGLAERRVAFDPGTGNLVRKIVLGGVIVAAVAGLGAAWQKDAPHWLQHRWDAFRAGQGSDVGASTDRLLTSGSNRYDFWRVAVLETEARPLTGYGAGNWSWRYLQLRHSGEEPASAHGSVWEFAADLGLPGLALYLAVIVIVMLGPLTALGTQEWGRGAALFAALVTGLGHAQTDWLWEMFPVGLLLAGLMGLGLGGYMRPREVRARHPLRLAGTIAACVVALLVIGPALLAERWTDAAYATGGTKGLALAERAARFNPFSAAPEFARASLATASHRPAVAVAALQAATQREPKNWAAWSALASAQRADGNAHAARLSCATARQLKPELVCSAS
jgi:hypothetical protein